MFRTPKYLEIFERIHNSDVKISETSEISETKNEKQEDDEIHRPICKKCLIFICLDNVSDFYVCHICGLVSEKNTESVFSFKDRKNHKSSFRKILPYNRLSQFNKYLNKQNNHMPHSVKNQVTQIFRGVLRVFELVCTKRKNFIRYEYVIIKILEILGLSVYSEAFKLPKSQLTINKYDLYWKDICERLELKYSKTL